MSLDTHSNTDLAYDTDVFRQATQTYCDVAIDLRQKVSDMQKCLDTLTDSGWTTPAGIAFLNMVDDNWSQNIEKYADLLDTLQQILIEASQKYDELTTNYIEKTKLG